MCVWAVVGFRWSGLLYLRVTKQNGSTDDLCVVMHLESDFQMPYA